MMEIFALVFSGLGLFFIGMRYMGAHLQQLVGRKMRIMITRAVSRKGSVALFGLAAGTIFQSVNAVTCLLLVLIAAGAIDTRRAFAAISWTNVGTATLVVIASLNMHLLVLVLLGLTGWAFFFNLDETPRYRHVIGGLLGIGMLFLGMDFLKASATLLKGTAWLHDDLAFAANYPVLGFAIGVAVAFATQSASAITLVAMSMTTAGVLSFNAGAPMVIGAFFGSALSSWPLISQRSGSARQIALFQLALRLLGAAALLCVYVADRMSGHPFLQPALQALGLSPTGQLAAMYVLIPVAAYLMVQILNAPLTRWIEKLSPPSHTETLGRPHYLVDGALAESESALILVSKELQRLLLTLPLYLAPLREEGDPSGPAVDVRFAAEQNVLKEAGQFLTEVVDRSRSREVLEYSVVLRGQNELLGSLQETLLAMCNECRNPSIVGEMRVLTGNIIESLHMMLEMLADAAHQPDPDDLHMLRALTHDRSELMDSIRRSLQSADQALSHDVQQSIFAATSLFERCVWLLRRYVLTLDNTHAREQIQHT
ncbi:Na/Pi symporter [Paraburkholderia lacunae]|uniref:Na+/Picotransporter n=1 Tax=Paraburkholderia lacunae TaxID=2211104 RepID=A0A370NEV6_9BURK|nr:Na/Pi symporter [Paraburkholderia lacunae]RDK04113.1 Na+/Picotransporter [Paraburkholderia lacunae]